MEKFVVSARKYRPQNFSTVVGQAHITTTLKNAINNNQLAHAFLFCGPRGVGKTTCARILAKTINCETKTKEGEACNTCNSCVSFDNGTSLNIHELDAASNNSVDDIRSLVEQVRFAPQAGEYKVYIVDEVHMLSSSAFNAFLKTLEEPPPYAIFILATTEKHKILPTILSRCQIFDFKRITTNDTVTHLKEICDKENTTAENAALHVIAQKSEGCMRDALSILDKIVSFTGGTLTYSNTLEHLNILDEDYFFKVLEYATEQKLSDALLLFDEINQKGFEGDTLLEGLTEFLRNLLVSKDARASVLLDVSEDFKIKYAAAAKEIAGSWIIAALNTLHTATLEHKQARNKRLNVEMALIKLCYLNQAITLLDTDSDAVSKKKLTDSAKPVSFKAINFIAIKETEKIIVAPKPVQKIEPSLVIEAVKPLTQTPTITKPATTEEKKSSFGSFGSLGSLRAQIMGDSSQNIVAKTLDMLSLDAAWKEYTNILFTEKKHPVVTQFKAARLSINDNDNFTITTDGIVQQKFIEGERLMLAHFLQDKFNNKLLKFVVEVIESENIVQELEKAIPLKQQYQMLVEKYPYIQKLKENLKLELDY
jgi:DNA polymerase III subunit gamma/tau